VRFVAKLVTVAVTVLVASALTTTIALGASSSGSAYGGQGGVEGQVETGGALPFTGLDLALLIGGGLLLLAVGAGLRRLGRVKT
jgi:hypothetical protein